MHKHRRVSNEFRGELAGQKNQMGLDSELMQRVKAAPKLDLYNGQMCPGAVVGMNGNLADASAFADTAPEWQPLSEQVPSRPPSPELRVPVVEATPPTPPQLKPWQTLALEKEQARKNLPAPVNRTRRVGFADDTADNTGHQLVRCARAIGPRLFAALAFRLKLHHERKSWGG